jgi:hypothetical protein
MQINPHRKKASAWSVKLCFFHRYSRFSSVSGPRIIDTVNSEGHLRPHLSKLFRSLVSKDGRRSEVGDPQVLARPESSLLHQRYPSQPAQGTRQDGAPEGHRSSGH